MPSELTNAYAKFKCLSKSRSYRFIIRSQNDVGISAEKSVVYIPKHADRTLLLNNILSVLSFWLF